jgi:hypothetical protein
MASTKNSIQTLKNLRMLVAHYFQVSYVRVLNVCKVPVSRAA